jgi:hypothetical protein
MQKNRYMNCNDCIQSLISHARNMSIILNYGGGRGIRTPAGFDTPVGFQDRSLQPNLGIPPYRQDLLYHILKRPVNKITYIFLKKIKFFPHSFY